MIDFIMQGEVLRLPPIPRFARRVPHRVLRHWLRREIPDWLSKFKNYDEYMEARPRAAASVAWKEYAHRAAVKRFRPPVRKAIADAEEIR